MSQGLNDLIFSYLRFRVEAMAKYHAIINKKISIAYRMSKISMLYYEAEEENEEDSGVKETSIIHELSDERGNRDTLPENITVLQKSNCTGNISQN